MSDERLELFLLPAGLDVTRPVTSTDLDGAVRGLRAWLRQTGLTPIGPALLGWDEWAVRQIRQPIAPIFAPPAEPPYRVVARPELMVVELPVALSRGTFNLAGLYDYVREYGLDPLGAPYVPLSGGANHALEGTSVGFLPVVPEGTSSLIPLPSWFTGKMGMVPRPPRYGIAASARLALEHTGLILLRTLIGIIMLGIVLLPYATFCGISGGVARGGLIREIVLASVVPLLVSCLALEALIGGVMLWTRLRAVRRWNAFWQRTPMPPPLALSHALEEGL
ncbi:MAG TPA: hypothetical protein VGE07_13115 [Herpetosiphonaceae bacterium]